MHRKTAAYTAHTGWRTTSTAAFFVDRGGARLANGIVERRSPYQLLTDNTLTISQRQWLREFNKRWEARI